MEKASEGERIYDRDVRGVHWSFKQFASAQHFGSCVSALELLQMSLIDNQSDQVHSRARYVAVRTALG